MTFPINASEITLNTNFGSSSSEHPNSTKIKIPKKMPPGQKKHLDNFCSVLKMRAMGQLCTNCADPNPYRYVPSRQLCGRCTSYTQKNGQLPSTQRTHFKCKKKVAIIKAACNHLKSIGVYVNEEFVNSQIFFVKPSSNLDESLQKRVDAQMFSDISETIMAFQNIEELTLDRDETMQEEPSRELLGDRSYEDELDPNTPIRRDGFLNIDFLREYD